ncbi:hypothetical protein [Yoonia tamlensis]|uniref:hypothetical protein n=1 Tax=Yoonia tamlensis TaxID=390270 RepID=UPI00104261EF|nr:hypothetical protein [Yoonia tamlensis]
MAQYTHSIGLSFSLGSVMKLLRNLLWKRPSAYEPDSDIKPLDIEERGPTLPRHPDHPILQLFHVSSDDLPRHAAIVQRPAGWIEIWSGYYTGTNPEACDHDDEYWCWSIVGGIYDNELDAKRDLAASVGNKTLMQITIPSAYWVQSVPR